MGDDRWKGMDILLMSLMIVFTFLPNFFVRLFILSLLTYLLTRVKHFSKDWMRLIFFSIFIIAFLMAPYWQIPPTSLGKIVGFILILLTAVLWGSWASDSISLGQKKNSIKDVIFVIALLIIFNFQQLFLDLHWRGDEDYHVNVIGYYIYTNSWMVWDTYFIIPLVIAAAYLGYRRLHLDRIERKNTFHILSIISLSSFLVGVYGTSYSPFELDIVARYPFFIKWMYLFFVSPDAFDLSLYRLLPFFSVLLLGIYIYLKTLEKTSDGHLAVLAGISFSTVPVVYYYSSLFYLEMPAVLGITIICFNLGKIIDGRQEDLRSYGFWPVLIFTIFIKETLVVLSLFISISRLVKQWIEHRDKGIFKELKITFVLITPPLLYLFFRGYQDIWKKYGFNFINLLQPENYIIFLESLLTQYGVFLLISIVGFFLMFIRGKKNQLSYLLILALSFIAFFFSDQAGYIGYSRWNLMLFPIFAAASYFAICDMGRKHAMMLTVIVIIFNIYLSPFFLDGSRVPGWGNPTEDVVEYTYPYELAVQYLQSQNHTKYLLITGQSYPYDIGFVLFKHNYHPPQIKQSLVNVDILDKTLEKEVFENFMVKNNLFKGADIPDTVIYHSRSGFEPDMDRRYGGFYIDKIIENKANRLIILYSLKQS